MENYGQIIHRTWDDSYVIKDGTYHVPNEGEYAQLWQDVHAYALANPAMVTEEYPYTPPPPTPEEIKQGLINGIQAYMNATAQTKGYDDIFTAISYENSEDEIFKAEGKACRVWRDKVWRACYNILDEVLAGTRDIPTLEELITELPKIDW